MKSRDLHPAGSRSSSQASPATNHSDVSSRGIFKHAVFFLAVGLVACYTDCMIPFVRPHRMNRDGPQGDAHEAARPTLLMGGLGTKLLSAVFSHSMRGNLQQ